MTPPPGRGQACRAAAGWERTPGPKHDCLGLGEANLDGQGPLELPLLSSPGRDRPLGGRSLRYPWGPPVRTPRHHRGVQPVDQGFSVNPGSLVTTGQEGALFMILTLQGRAKTLGKCLGPCPPLWPVTGTQVDASEGMLSGRHQAPPKARRWAPPPHSFPHSLAP